MTDKEQPNNGNPHDEQPTPSMIEFEPEGAEAMMNRQAWTNLENPVGFEELTFGGLRVPGEEQACLKVSFSRQAGTNELQDEVLTLVLSHDSLGELIDLLERGTRWLDETLPDTPFSEIVWYE